MASKINPATIIDEVARNLATETTQAEYIARAELDVECKCLIEGVAISELSLDEDGYYTSQLLIRYAALLFKKHLFMGYWGSSDGDGVDVYRDKLTMINDEIKSLEPLLTRESILGLAREDGSPKGRMSVIRQIPLINGSGYGGSYNARNF